MMKLSVSNWKLKESSDTFEIYLNFSRKFEIIRFRLLIMKRPLHEFLSYLNDVYDFREKADFLQVSVNWHDCNDVWLKTKGSGA